MKLYPFFSYFGSKFRLARMYSSPVHKHIIEPFAGSAGYALLHYKFNVSLYDSYKPVIELWNYLIHVSSKEIEGLPLGPFNKEHPVSKAKISEAAKILIGFWLTESQTYSSTYPLSKVRGDGWTARKRSLIARQVNYIRHWSAEYRSYDEIPNQKATWFVDPPYENAGKRYKKSDIDYSKLSDWCANRKGQIIVCEQEPADWLPFSPIQKQPSVFFPSNKVQSRNASNKKYTELVYEHRGGIK